MLRPLGDVFQAADFPDLLVGIDPPDDAAIWRLDDERALVMTTDFFTPVVDDAYDYGAIAAANALSDVYAMGGEPFLALNIAALPPNLPFEISAEILRGAAETARKAGVVIAGGHTVQDQEPKFGLVVIGFVHPQHILIKGGVKAGDRLYLSKPLGFGATTTALKRGQAAAEDVQEVVGWMTRLNQAASRLAREFELTAATDVTGFSLLGHAMEMADASGLGLRLDFPHIPFVSCARKYADLWAFPGGAADNNLHFGPRVRFAPSLDEASQMLLFDPQTSGGLLLAVPPEKAADFEARAVGMEQPVWQIGEAISGSGIDVR